MQVLVALRIGQAWSCNLTSSFDLYGYSGGYVTMSQKRTRSPFRRPAPRLAAQPARKRNGTRYLISHPHHQWRLLTEAEARACAQGINFAEGRNLRVEGHTHASLIGQSMNPSSSALLSRGAANHEAHLLPTA